MVTARASRTWLVIMLSAAVFLVRAVAMMMGPLLVAMAAAFDTSVAAMGQLAGAMGITWGITAPLVGPLSDIYGRRRIGLTGLVVMAVATLGSLLVGDYRGAPHLPSPRRCRSRDDPAEQRGRHRRSLCANGARKTDQRPYQRQLRRASDWHAGGGASWKIGGWRLPFIGVGAVIIGVCALQWHSLPGHPANGTGNGLYR